MADTDASGLWPKRDTLVAGDEDLPPDSDALLDPRAADNSDGHLEDDDYWGRHPDAV